MTVTMLYFAAVRDLIGHPEEELAIPDSVHNLADLVAVLPELHPALKDKLRGVRFAINETFAVGTDVIQSGDVIAVIPPVAGG